MPFADLLWIPSDIVVACFWYSWLTRDRRESTNRKHRRAGLASLLLATISTALFTFAVAATWATGAFSGYTQGLNKLFALAIVLNILCFLLSFISVGMTRIFGLGSSVLLTVAWAIFMISLRSLL